MAGRQSCTTCGAACASDAPDSLCPACSGRPLPGAEPDTPPDSDLPIGGVGLAAAGAGRSILAALDETLGDVPRVLLRDADSRTFGPVARVGSDQLPRTHRHGPDGRYQIFGEIARGGMGAVLRGRDADLGRDLAIKVLLASHRHKPDLVRRFVEEAQISGQLQHPGIIPVYELGAFADKRPYFTMKLVKGKTLAALLADRRDPRQDLPRLLSVFEQVCQTVAYAHARGVVHRDIKPSNVMVGSFGEVQVMDWGLAKVLEAGGAADDRKSVAVARPAETIIQTLRSGSLADASMAGSLMGTPGYISPEQARGDVDALDARADVFGLGAVLCEVLSGSPPYTGRSPSEVLRRAARADLSEALARLDACAADPGLIALARQCLAPEPADRPRDAGAVAAGMRAHLDGVQERLRRSELDKVRAQEKAARLKYLVAAAAAVVLLVGGGVVTALVLNAQARARNARFEQALAVAEQLERRTGEEAAKRIIAAPEWNEAMAAVDGALLLMPDGTQGALLKRADGLRDKVRSQRDAAESDRKLLAGLAAARFAQQDLGLEGTSTAYATALAAAQLDVDRLSPDEAAERVRRRPAPVALDLAAYLDGLASLRRSLGRPPDEWRRLLRAARAGDPDAYRARLRTLLEAEDLGPALTELKSLVDDPHAADLAPGSTVLLASALLRAGDGAAHLALLRRAADVHPDDLWVNFVLAQALAAAEGRDQDALRYFSAARAIRPETSHDMGHLLQKMGRNEEALAVFQDLVRRVPNDPRHAGCLALALKDLGRTAEAKVATEHALDLARRRIAADPQDQPPRYTLGFLLRQSGDPAGATAAYLAALRELRQGDQAMIYGNLVNLRPASDDADAAVAGLVQAIRLRPAYPTGPAALVEAIKKQGRAADTWAVVRESFGDKTEMAPAYLYVGQALLKSGRKDDALLAMQESQRLSPGESRMHDGTGSALLALNRPAEAAEAFREAIRLKGDSGWSHASLGDALLRQGRPAEAVEELVRAGALGFTAPWVKDRLGDAVEKLVGSADAATAAARVRRALGDGPLPHGVYGRVGQALRDRGRLDEAVEAYREAARIAPDDAVARADLGLALFTKGDRDGAAAEYAQVERLGSSRGATAKMFHSLAGQGAWLHDPAARRLLTDGDTSTYNDYLRAIVRLTFGGDRAAYAEVAGRLFHQHEQTTDLRLAETVARLCAFAEQPPVDPARVAALAERAVTPGNTDGFRRYTAGLAHYRAGNHAAAVARLEESLRIDTNWPATALNLPVLAMAHHRLGNAKEAAKWLDEAERATVAASDTWNDALEFSLLREEARSVVRGTARPTDIGIVSPVATADYYRRVGRPKEGMAILRDAVRQRPADVTAQIELGLTLAAAGDAAGAEGAFAAAAGVAPGDSAREHFALGRAYAHAGRWAPAAVAFNRALEIDPSDHWNWFAAAPLFLEAGDVEGYRRIGHEIVRRFGKSDPNRPELAERTAKVLLLAPAGPSDAATDAATVATGIELADRAVRGTESHRFYWYFQVCKGFAEYRAGRFEESLRWLDKAGTATMPDAPAFRAYVYAVRAMAEHRLGRGPQARLSLEEARTSMSQCPDPARGNGYPEVSWHDWIIGRTLLREAEALLGGGATGARGPG